MNEKNWQINTSKVMSWLDTLDLTDKKTKKAHRSMMLNIEMGNDAEDDEERSDCWNATRAIGKRMEGFPNARTGRYSEQDPKITDNALNVNNTLTNAFVQSITDPVAIEMTLALHRQKGGVSYSTFAEWVQGAIVDKALRFMSTAQKDWGYDGHTCNENGVPVIEKPVEENSTEADNGEVAREA